ncbi:hypothetical protein [Roseateles amylovorans]|uniref:PLD phosphodiesterase domain-containing protein n=1 Tax=Roseateles amylovorans TaxID=2978473 RepID=A0ABY6AUG5_9BURK|nr:hypothetical protein [Roseateles amylovorans]UXH76568.1 hypothetical protein N4261_16125 [Roseateles amylovorans]
MSAIRPAKPSRRQVLSGLAAAALAPNAALAQSVPAPIIDRVGGGPPPQVRNCGDLYKMLSSIDPKGQAVGKSYALTQGNRLTPNFWASAPFGAWSNYPHHPTVSPFSQALKDAVQLGIVAGQTSKRCFIDLFNLQQGTAGLFDDPALNPTPLRQLADFINALPAAATPTLRYVTGFPDTTAFAPDPLVRSLFAPGLIRHPKATVYMAAYQPNVVRSEFHPGDFSKLLEALLDFGFKAVSEADASLYGASMQAVAGLRGTIKLLFEMMLSQAHFPAVTWNHSKIFAMNGAALVTGGINYWADYYASRPRTTVLDLSLQMDGDAAVSAHRFADESWTYFNGLPSWDTGSWAKSAVIANGLSSFKDTRQTPLFGQYDSFQAYSDNQMRHLADYGPFASGASILAVGKTGQWPDNTGLPSQYVDAMRDLLIAMVEAIGQSRQGNAGLGLAAYLAHRLDEVTQPDFAAMLAAQSVNPAHWASRTARVVASASATQVLRLSQQSLVDAYAAGSAAFRALVKVFNTMCGTDWDGWVWPWDLLNGTAVGCSRMLQAKGAAQIQLIMSYGDSGWSDSGTPITYKARLAASLRMLAATGTIAPIADIPGLVERSVDYRRVSPGITNDGNHAKAVIVDNSLAYIGSDNAYPNYNLQFGTWLDDANAVRRLVDNYWQPLWDKHTVKG